MIIPLISIFVITLLVGTIVVIRNEQQKSLAQKQDWQKQEEYWPSQKRKDERWLNPASSSLDQQRWALILGMLVALLLAVGIFFIFS